MSNKNHSMQIYNNRAYFDIYGTNDEWNNYSATKNDYTTKFYTLTEFNKYFKANSLDILKEVFLADEICSASRMSCYYSIGDDSSIYNRYGNFPAFIQCQKDFDEILCSITDIYSRLIKECDDKNEKKQALANFIKIMTAVNIINCSLASKKSIDYFCIIRYIDRLPISESAKKSVYNQTYGYLNQFNYDKKGKYAKDFTDYIRNKDVDRCIANDEKYICQRKYNLLKEYTNTYELPNDEIRKLHCDVYINKEKHTKNKSTDTIKEKEYDA